VDGFSGISAKCAGPPFQTEEHLSKTAQALEELEKEGRIREAYIIDPNARQCLPSELPS
jgi:hypothetical protein